MNGRQRAAALPVEFFARPTALVAQELLGSVIVGGSGTRRVTGVVVEVEAYLGGDDPASHGYRLRRTERNAALFGPPGTWYVYRSYGLHWCANLVCEAEGYGAAVLFRAVEPREGLSLMRRRRRTPEVRQLCSGPGKLCQALGITDALDGLSITGSPIRLYAPPGEAGPAILATPRIGISKAADWPLRFVVAGSRWASRRS